MKKAFALVLAAAIPAAGSVHSQESDGMFESSLTRLGAITLAGSPAPQGNAFCAGKFAAWIGSPVNVRWKINADGSRLATATLKGIDTQLNIATVPGSFMGFPGDSGPEGVDRMVFTLGANGAEPRLDVLLTGDERYNCLLSSQ